MEKKLTQKEINNIVWKACDSFRGVLSSGQYKDYVLTMLFVKYVSDVWKDKKNFYTEKYKGDKTRVERALANERFKLPENATFDYLFENRNDAQLGDLIDRVLDQIEDANRLKLAGVFRNITFNSEPNLGQTKDRNRRLKNLLVDFSEMDLQPSHLEGNDVIGDAYEYLIARFAGDEIKKSGEFYTPSEVSVLLAKLLQPQPGNRINDPACGSGSLLIKLAKEVGSSNFSLYGQEVNGSTWALARMNMFLHEIDNATIEWGDTLNNPRLLEGDELMKFDIVAANPPFSLDKWGAENAVVDQYSRFHRGIPPKSKGDYAFISHMIETTYADTGRVGVIMPHGVLFRGSSEAKIRQQLIEENLLEAVIGLPANLFYGTSIPAAVLIFNKAKGANTDVLFIDASKGFETGKNQNRLREEDIAHIVTTYKAFKAASPLKGEGQIIEDKYAYRATFNEIKENDFNLNIPRYVDTFEEEEEVDIKAVQDEINLLKNQIADVESDMEKYLKELGY
ncbi:MULTISPECIES: type I restriction-modification system subunit M [Elizabethkingia]|uniref:site-specific DNA-methyltransferase (adenine-specific) n=1 Tax=Elizabethkingia anophelis TaxID=1117645 RepID=A0A455ZCR8_9FLAO|nr:MULTISPECIES: type I restriction-modification system subunit M [Elizabethkingia]MDX8574564.1 type I restriction-modification system subunit M [Elizabethkingia sp. HX WYD]DAC74649.1 TPA_exp: Type I restriction-modification system, DNA-methyltransferase subunit M [Elizabethkingia anophelis]